ncbi:hypothetical protein Ddye_011208 [Dipteronia dyeriana]|uniref:Uncharacterized protein n=1 Tax=Dipteronia dyeriana TaxID=168575 RepID=A0AAD9UBG7_9ROSI|nr:hypothetical protein Ddye_011208 [Dipteronia dyeriana]
MYFLGTVVSWRPLAMIALVPCLLQVIGLFFIPESPRWQAKMGPEKELEITLQRLRSRNVDISKEAAAIRLNFQLFMFNFDQNISYFEAFKLRLTQKQEMIVVQDYKEICERALKDEIFNLFQQRFAYSLTVSLNMCIHSCALYVGVGLLLMQQLIGTNGIAFYSSSIFEEATDFSSKVRTISMATVQASSIGMCSSCFVIGVAFSLQFLDLFVRFQFYDGMEHSGFVMEVGKKGAKWNVLFF